MIFVVLQPWLLFNLLFGPQDSVVRCPRIISSKPKNCVCEIHDRFNPEPKLAINCVDFNDDPGHLRDQILFYKGYNISELWITNSTLSHLPNGTLSYFKSLNRVSLLNVTLGSISDGNGRSVFAGLENTLKWFYLDDVSFMESFDWSQFRFMRFLNIIHIFHSYLETSDNIQVLGNVNIKEFYVWGSTGLDSIGKTRTFSKNRGLIELGLRRIGLKTIQRDLLPRPAEQLKTIEICQNPIRTIPSDFFEDMPVLQYVDLSQNQIILFEPELFRPILLTGIRSLRLGRNLFFCKDGEVWFHKEPNDPNPFRYDGLKCFFPDSSNSN